MQPDDLTAAISTALCASRDDAESVERAALALWDEMAARGMVDGFGGAECLRVMPRALAVIHTLANAGPDMTVDHALAAARLRVAGPGEVQ